MVYRAVHGLVPASSTFVLDHSAFAYCVLATSVFRILADTGLTFALGNLIFLHLAWSSLSFACLFPLNHSGLSSNITCSAREALPDHHLESHFHSLHPVTNTSVLFYLKHLSQFSIFLFTHVLCVSLTGIYIPGGQTAVFLVHCSIPRRRIAGMEE